MWVKVRERPREPDRLAEMVSRERNFIAPLGILALDLSDPRLASLVGPLRARLDGKGGTRSVVLQVEREGVLRYIPAPLE